MSTPTAQPPTASEVTKSELPEEASAPPARFLSPEDLLRVEMSQFRLQAAGAQLREARLIDQLDDLNMGYSHLQLQVKSHELTIARLNRRLDSSAKTQLLSATFEKAGKQHEELKAEVGAKHGINDWNTVAYDDVTGKISLLPDPVPKE